MDVIFYWLGQAGQKIMVYKNKLFYKGIKSWANTHYNMHYTYYYC